MNKVIALGKIARETQDIPQIGSIPDESGQLVGFALDEGKENTPCYFPRLIGSEVIEECTSG